MSKLMTIYSVMKEMKDVKEVKGTAHVKVISNGEEVFNHSKEVDCMMHRNGSYGEGHHVQGRHSVMRHRFGSDHGGYHVWHENQDVDDEKVTKRMQACESKLLELGFTPDEVWTLKAHRHNRLKRSKMSRMDRLMMLIKLLDKTECAQRDDHKVLKLNLTPDDAPSFWQEMLAEKNNLGSVVRKMLNIIQEKDLHEICNLHQHDEQHEKRYAQLREITQKIAETGVALETLSPKSFNIEVVIDNKNHIEKIITLMHLSDDSGKIVSIEGQRIASF